MPSQFSAAEQGLGYLYQVRYSLYLLLNKHEDCDVRIECLDDVSFETSGSPFELIQLKHRAITANLTDSCSDLWKPIRVWSTKPAIDFFRPNETKLFLITTGYIEIGSIASFLRDDENRNINYAHNKLLGITENSRNQALIPAFDAFNSLSARQQLELLDSIYIIDKSPNIEELIIKIKNILEITVSPSHLNDLYERVEGWWFGRVVTHLMGQATFPIGKQELHNRIRDFAGEYRLDSLPIEFLDTNPEESSVLQDERRLFVHQLHIIDINVRRIENAILDYYRAFEQRSKWIADDLSSFDELSRYENKLINEWDRLRLALQDDLITTGDEDNAYKNIGRQLYKWMELNADIRIRPQVTEGYVMRGSYHMLADKTPPAVWWHPKYCEYIRLLLTGTQG